MTALERTDLQRREALAIANDTRSFRSRYKRGIAIGIVDGIATIADPPDPRLETMKVYDLIVAMPKIGSIKAKKVLLAAGVSPSKTVGSLSDRQRREITERLPRLQPGVRREMGMAA